MEQLFGTLRGDFAPLKQEIAAEVKEMKQEVIELGQRIDTLEQAQDALEDCHRRELLTLQDKNQEFQYQIEDLENRTRRFNIQIKGVPSQAVNGKLEDFVERLFRYVAPDLKDQTVSWVYVSGTPCGRVGASTDTVAVHHTFPMTTVHSLNVRGLNAAVKRQALLIHLRDARADLYLLQETHLARADWKGLKSQWFDRQFHSSGPGRRAGVAILLATNFQGWVLGVQAEIPGRLLSLHIDLRGHRLTVVNIYGPNEQQKG
ncbi:hypothetical protein NDU88_003038 [Pleurodeles waltl]|uniref:Endonuclease/exonuclease/phosphatase domain-containing protein n=1 Tax=Pleurodeles waltl TaxID=8319 RepID=A0AAV7KUF8_PLEWA|nr:hypothetical protein NDU88_003038 [Pleurodeles waltl]